MNTLFNIRQIMNALHIIKQIMNTLFNIRQKIFLNIFENGVDKRVRLCYNISRKRGKEESNMNDIPTLWTVMWMLYSIGVMLVIIGKQ